jgi:hypothetical protein
VVAGLPAVDVAVELPSRDRRPHDERARKRVGRDVVGDGGDGGAGREHREAEDCRQPAAAPRCFLSHVVTLPNGL